MIDFIMLCDISRDCYYVLTSSLDNTWWLVGQVRTYSHSGHSIYMYWFPYVHDYSEYSLILSSIAMIASFY